MVKRLLFLDDNPARHRAFKTMTIGCLVTHVWTSEECIKTLSCEEPFDCVFLDLGGGVFVQEVQGSGTEVVYHIRDRLVAERYPREIVIHSWNPAGALRMEQAIACTGIPVKRIPFKFPR